MQERINHLAPEVFSIRCPKCAAEAEFSPPNHYLDGEEAEKARKDPSVTGVRLGGGYVVVRYPKLLPWKHPSNRQHAARGDLWGICKCVACGHHNKHRLDWPDNAYFIVEVRGRRLWAWTRADASALKNYIASTDRDIRRQPPQARYFLRHVPKEFLLVRNREAVVKALDRLLRGQR